MGICMYYPKLRDLREDHNLKQKEVAAILNIDQRVYSNYETGNRNPSVMNPSTADAVPVSHCGARSLVGSDSPPNCHSLPTRTLRYPLTREANREAYQILRRYAPLNDKTLLGICHPERSEGSFL